MRPNNRAYGKADIHLHTDHSDGMMTARELLDYVEESTDLDLIFVTDHDHFEGGYAARELWAGGRYSFEVGVGSEVTTREGHLLCLFLEAPVKLLRPCEDTIREVHRRGGICIVPHPLSWLTRSLGQGAIERVLASEEPEIYFDGIETMNNTLAGKITGDKIATLNQMRYHLPECGGSDAHFKPVVGTTYTTYPGRGAADFRRALVERTTRPGSGHTPSLRELGLPTLAHQQVRSLIVLPAKHIGRFLRRKFKVQGPKFNDPSGRGGL